MKVKELIQKLKEQPEDADVWYIWDGAARTEANQVYLSNNGDVLIGDDDIYVINEKDKPFSIKPKT